ncbi:MAG: hypothetical protein K2P70_04880 [Hyphomonadaceae bacterium]|nr:hypothetical protein [Hyphomonadaceae bacterium]
MFTQPPAAPDQDAMLARVDLSSMALSLADTGAFRSAHMVEAAMLLGWPELAIAWHDLADADLRGCIEARCRRAVSRTVCCVFESPN